ncbi:16S rRNA (guanine(527)-N(7))-methyltransferase RsmG [Lentibacillus amyloliquefaciens]|uniref:Ribosomal RNA small subunit methyltransferase G n=1 Tax=Lentibacillus amyloliquefaciens TaxID=1472767 RepID=A0A0U3W8Y2_9BACI|nr:16S rRNA (guanine(527)-N(7))-methyltransferase RsmG [Lentibacillus amyloliquefaciens]ALX49538.1 16S rRNA (guanine(527)-N(7))-methyltransferase RsmG [Lentibacillus amyloliquefaciens]
MEPEQFVSALREQGIELNEKQQEQFADYYQILVEWNKKINLTTVTEEEDVYLKHFYDSVSAAFYHDFSGNLSICDVGAGAGFPSIPLKICFPALKITIVDSLQKRINFLNQLAARLELHDVAFYHDRAETFGKNKQFRETFDIVISRAVARMSVLSELCLPLTRKHGLFLAMKGSKADDELNDAKHAIEILGGQLDVTHAFELPEEKSERSIIKIHKKRTTSNRYPRKPGVPNKSPLI